MLVHRDHRVWNGLDDRTQPRLAFGQRGFDSFTLRDVHQHIDAADESPGHPVERRRIRDKGDAGPVRSLTDGLPAANGPVFPESDGHRAVLMGHPPAIGPIKSPWSAPALVAERGTAAPKPDGGFVVEGEPALGIGGVNGDSEPLDERVDGFLGPLAVVDVGANADPAFDPAVRTAQRAGPRYDPAKRPIAGAPDPHFGLIVRLLGDRLPPTRQDTLAVLRVHDG